ncbi:hypothetical protein A2W24_01125 [Microgenomates group bacterium RBG_16_45_19]|nr:MAG: hypothetical protein A2W24_01125 [Microgenomates group bacterium RBG_16_45_19]
MIAKGIRTGISCCKFNGIATLLFLVIMRVFAYAQCTYELWTSLYNGPGNGRDVAYSIIVDKSNFVYVTGQSYGGASGYDYATIKYAPNGDTIWVRRYNGTGNGLDIAYALQVDNSGYIYVTGLSSGSGSGYDYATIKYTPNGDAIWVRRYNGSGNGLDVAYALQVDNSGCVYVTGLSSGGASGYDYATIKYASNGDTVWVRRYNGKANGSDEASTLKVDNSGYVYVTGGSTGSGSGSDYATIKYTPNGDTIWVRRYNGSGNGFDVAYALQVDDSGYVYITGGSTGSGSGYDYTTIKYAPNGDSIWVRRYNGSGNDVDIAKSIKVDSNYYVYVSGWSFSHDSDEDYTTIKYTPNGDSVWIRRYNGTANNNDLAYALEVDERGQVYVTGKSSSGEIGYDYATIKYTPDGNTIWVRRYNGTGNDLDIASALGVDDSGYVYVTGLSTGIGSNYDYATIKYAPGNSLSGANILVQLTDSLQVLFDSILISGETTVEIDSFGPFPPYGFDLVPNYPPKYHNVRTSAVYSGSIRVCLTYAQDLVSNELNLQLYRHSQINQDSFQWDNTTISVDTITNEICGQVLSLSKFILVEPVCLGKPGDADASGNYTLGDLIAIVNYMFNKPGCISTPICWLSGLLCRGDWNGSGTITLGDVIRGLSYIFNKDGGPWTPVSSGSCCSSVP